MPKVNKFKITVPFKNGYKEFYFDNSLDACIFLNLKSYSVLYNLIKNNTKYKHSSNKHLEEVKVERINQDVTRINKRNRDKLLKEHKEKFILSLQQIVL